MKNELCEKCNMQYIEIMNNFLNFMQALDDIKFWGVIILIICIATLIWTLLKSIIKDITRALIRKFLNGKINDGSEDEVSHKKKNKK